MNRADLIKQALLWDATAKAAADKAKQYRAQLDEQARAELEQGVVPTWRLPDLATVSLPVSKETPVVEDPAAFVAWVEQRYPTEVETTKQVRAAFQAALFPTVICEVGKVIDGTSGEIIPGLGVREGGMPGALRILPAKGVKAALVSEVGALVEALGAALGEPTGGNEVPE